MLWSMDNGLECTDDEHNVFLVLFCHKVVLNLNLNEFYSVNIRSSSQRSRSAVTELINYGLYKLCINVAMPPITRFQSLSIIYVHS